MNIRKKLLSLLCVAVLLTTMVSAAAFPAVTAADPLQSFENGGATTLFAAPGATTTVSDEVAHTGQKAIKMTINDDYGNQNTNRVVYEDADGQVSFAFGTEVNVSYWVYAPVAMKAKARLVIDPDLSNMSQWVSGKGFDLLETTLPAGEWVQVTKTVTLTRPDAFASYESTYLSVGVVYPDSVDAGTIDYTVYLDDVSIELNIPQHETQSFEAGGTTHTVAITGSTAVSTDKAHTGEKSLKLTIDKDYGSSNTHRAVYEDLSGRVVPLTVGEEYTLSAWVYFEDSFASKIRMVYDPDLSNMTNWASGKVGIEIAATQETGKWIYITENFTAKALGSETTTYVSFGVASTNALPSGTAAYTVYVDDLLIAPKGSIVDTATHQDFESGSLTKVYGETAISTEQAHSGDYSVKMHIIDDRSNNNCERVLFEGNYGLKSFAVGRKYTVSAWVYAVESFNAKVKLISDPSLSDMGTWLSGKGQDMAVTTLPAGQWTRITNTMTVNAIQGESSTYLALGVTAADAVAATGDVSYTVYVDDVSIVERANFTADDVELQLSGTDPIGVGLKLSYGFSKTDVHYSEDATFGLLSGTGTDLAADVAGVTDTVCTAVPDGETVTIRGPLTVGTADLDTNLTVRPYVLVDGNYVYGSETTVCAARLAGIAYRTATNEGTKARLKAAFATSETFSADPPESALSFVTFGDFHYNPTGTATSLRDLDAVIERADTADADFVFSLGDFFQNYGGSAQQYNAFHNNTYGLPTYNIYGNHELENGGTMDRVTPNLVYDTDAVVWGTADGAMDTSIGYYYFEQNGVRIIALDNNYYTDSEGVWHHNPTGSWGAPEGAVKNSCLGDVQTAWLTSVLDDAAEKDIPCLIMIHIPIDGVLFTGAGDAADVRAILNAANAKNPGTVLAVFNGHEHLDNQVMVDGILYKYVNVVRGCFSDNVRKETEPYDYPYDGLTYEYDEYDSEGNFVATHDRAYSSDRFWQSMYATDAMSSLVTVYEDGSIFIDGYESTWLNGEEPLTMPLTEGIGPRHSTLSVVDGVLTVGHVHVTDTAYLYDESGHWTGCGTCDELTGNYGTHNYTDNVCDVCGYTLTLPTMNPITSVYQYVGGGKDNSSLQAAAGSAVYTHTDGSLRTAFRVPASYVTDSADFSTILLDGKSYPIKERGIILGTAGQPLTVDSPAKIATTDGFDSKYWAYDSATGTVTYTALVKNVKKEQLNVGYIARSYVIIDVNGTETVVYSDASVSFTPQSLYDKASAQIVAGGGTAPIWFPKKDHTDDGVIDLT